MYTLLLWALLAASGPDDQQGQPAKPGDNTQMITTPLAAPPGAVDGNPSPDYTEVLRLIGAKDFATAQAKINPILDHCQAQDKDTTRRVVNFSDAQEFLFFSTAAILQKKGTDIVWVRDDCAAAYKGEAFIDVETGDAQGAFQYLDMAEKRAPFWVEIFTERGFLLVRTGHPDEALAAYRKAISLTDQFKSEAHVKPLALRGLGFVYTEMGRLDEAQKAYEDSLMIEPGNQLARNELQYIDGLRKQQAPPKK